jgi:hypothetical protein
LEILGGFNFNTSMHDLSVEIYHCSEEPAASILHPEDGGSKFLQNIGKFLPYYMALHHRR